MVKPRISVIIPTHNGADTLPSCLESLRESTLPRTEIIVVDDASSDNSGEIARRLGCRVVRVDENIGAARAKNRGAQMASGDVLFFTDDDVLVSREAIARVAGDLDDADVAGVVGLLDGKIPFDDLASNLKNLWMRFTYAKLPRRGIGLFYTSVAAMRRDNLSALGGFDENYRGASIAEDTEFGQRAWAAGHLLILDDGVTVTHCKHYTLREVLTTDFLRARALMLLRLRKWGQKFYTSVPLFYQLAVPIIFLALACLALTPITPMFLAAGAFFLIAFSFLFLPWFTYLAQERGVRFAFAAALFQPIDAIAVGFGMAQAVFDFMRGARY
jgi:glycosyltransferase involved in cell wall biosynthesis